MNRLQAFLFWLLVLIYVNLVPPTQYSIIAFFVIIFFALFATFRIFFTKIKLNLLLTLYLISLLLLRFFKLTTIVNLFLDSLLFISVYFFA